MSFVDGLRAANEAYWRLSDAEPAEDTAPPCPDPECEGRGETERDGDHIYFECDECGYTFGYQRQDQSPTSDSCAIGVPAEVRARTMTQSVPVQITRKG